MSLVITKNRTMLAAGLLLPFTASVWLLGAREGMSTSTFAALAALILGITGVGLTTWRNGQAAGSVSQLIYETDTSAVPMAAVTEPRDASRG